METTTEQVDSQPQEKDQQQKRSGPQPVTEKQKEREAKRRVAAAADAECSSCPRCGQGMDRQQAKVTEIGEIMVTITVVCNCGAEAVGFVDFKEFTFMSPDLNFERFRDADRET